MKATITPLEYRAHRAELSLTNLERAYQRAMQAKETVFLAQDALSLARSDWAEGRLIERESVLTRLERDLSKLRNLCEKIDRDARPVVDRIRQAEREAAAEGGAE
jgi:hypothetical protein